MSPCSHAERVNLEKKTLVGGQKDKSTHIHSVMHVEGSVGSIRAEPGK
jgi:hypothetical protein